MTAGWHFQPLTPGSTIREPIAGAFFAGDAVSAPGEALVREGIQNSLDATLPENKTLVRISLIVESEDRDWQEASVYFADARAHYMADGNGLSQEDVPGENEPRAVLIFEDFHTCGLQGDPATPYPPEERGENNFFHFFRSEGLSDKEPGKRGSWGLGKDAFFRASRINTVFGLTVRNDDGRRLLMGKIVLKSHWVGDDCCQDGYFGVRADSENTVMPIESHDGIEQFQRAFRLDRQNDPGLSIIVPWFDPEVTGHALLQAVFKNYSYAILAGDLDVIVEVETAGIETWLEKDNLLNEARNFLEQADILPAIELAEWAVSDDARDNLLALGMTDPARGWSWSRNLFTDELLKALDGKLKNGERIALRVPITVRKRDGASASSHFDVYMVNDNTGKRIRPIFVRDGIVISDVRAPFMKGIRALVIVNDAPLSEFLRKAENPSHTIWQGQQVKKDYTSGVGDLRFVVESVRRICDLVAAEDKEEDRCLLADIFPVRGRGGNRSDTPPLPPLPPPQPSRFAIGPAQGGFAVSPGAAPIPAGSHAEISVAYDVRRGSAMSQYRIADFQLNLPPVQCQCDGAEVIDMGNNTMIVRISEPDDLRITVTGFDPNRQIHVDVKESGGA